MTLKNLNILYCKFYNEFLPLPIDSKPGQIIVSALSNNVDPSEEVKFCIVFGSENANNFLRDVDKVKFFDVAFHSIALFNDKIIIIKYDAPSSTKVFIRKLTDLDYIELGSVSGDFNIDIVSRIPEFSIFKLSFRNQFHEFIFPYILMLRNAIENAKA